MTVQPFLGVSGQAISSICLQCSLVCIAACQPLRTHQTFPSCHSLGSAAAGGHRAHQGTALLPGQQDHAAAVHACCRTGAGPAGRQVWCCLCAAGLGPLRFPACTVHLRPIPSCWCMFLKTACFAPPICSHVYNIEPPANASEYLHRAGRSGRIGSTIEGARQPCEMRPCDVVALSVTVLQLSWMGPLLLPLMGKCLAAHAPFPHGPPHAPLLMPASTRVCPAGVVTTLVTPEQLPALQSMAAELGITIAELPPPPPELPSEAEAESDLERARQGLEDLFNLY